MGKKPNKLRKTKSVSFRVPEQLRLAIIEAAKEVGVSQTDFMIGGAMGLLRQIGDGASFKDIMLPEGYTLPYLPTEKARMVAIRATPEALALIQDSAARLWHSRTGLILWGSALRIKRSTNVALPMNKEGAQAPRLSSVQFRVPLMLQRRVDELTPDNGLDLRTFIATATEHYLQNLDKTPAKNLLLPKGFSISTISKIIAVPISNGLMQQGVYATAPRLYHSIRSICLLAAAWKAFVE